MNSRICACVSDYNALAEKKNLGTRLRYDEEKSILYLCTEEGLRLNYNHSKLQSGNPDMIFQTVRAMMMQLCFEYGE